MRNPAGLASLLLLLLLLVSACGGGGPAPSAAKLPPYPGDPVPVPTSGPEAGAPPPVDPAAPGLLEAASCPTPHDLFGVLNLSGVAIERYGFSREGEFIPGLGSLADHGDMLYAPFDVVEPGALRESTAVGPQPFDGIPHAVIARDVYGRRYVARWTPLPGARGFVLLPSMLVATP